MNVFLIGMSSVGKTKIGEQLAKELKLNFIDEDDYFEEENGPIHIIREKITEEEYTLKKDNVVQYLKTLNDVLVATGGQTGMKPIMNEFDGIKILIRPSLKWILKKYEIKKKDKSPKNLRRKLVFKSNRIIREEYYKRNKEYMKYADIIIDTTHLKTYNTIKVIVKRIKKYQKKKRLLQE